MLQSLRTIPPTCSQRITKLNQTALIKWLLVAPKPDVLTVLCSKHEPSDVTSISIGKFKLNIMCKVYAPKIIIQV